MDMEHTNWRGDAACLHADPDLFFPIGTAGPVLRPMEEAKRTCLVRTPCLMWALEQAVYAASGEALPRMSGAPSAKPPSPRPSSRGLAARRGADRQGRSPVSRRRGEQQYIAMTKTRCEP